MKNSALTTDSSRRLTGPSPWLTPCKVTVRYGVINRYLADVQNLAVRSRPLYQRFGVQTPGAVAHLRSFL